ncbi:unnamed protein product [Protopolystoma xenopodis]|uniref:Uncharacterized protein n=1 Tax=Protopolystoma xenopodis TaxID=117903 RepID=A0A3S5AKB7_9PLAT|nr:unnamed protein product [Protopolystoma xenopodis]
MAGTSGNERRESGNGGVSEEILHRDTCRILAQHRKVSCAGCSHQPDRQYVSSCRPIGRNSPPPPAEHREPVGVTGRLASVTPTGKNSSDRTEEALLPASGGRSGHSSEDEAVQKDEEHKITVTTEYAVNQKGCCQTKSVWLAVV